MDPEDGYREPKPRQNGNGQGDPIVSSHGMVACMVCFSSSFLRLNVVVPAPINCEHLASAACIQAAL